MYMENKIIGYMAWDDNANLLRFDTEEEALAAGFTDEHTIPLIEVEEVVINEGGTQYDYTVCPDCQDTVLDINMLYDEDGSTALHCTNCAHEMLHTDPGTIPEYDYMCGDYGYEEYEPSPYDGTYSEM